MKKPKYTIRKELVESFVEEWYEYRVYSDKPRTGFAIVSFKSEGEAKNWVKSH